MFGLGVYTLVVLTRMDRHNGGKSRSHGWLDYLEKAAVSECRYQEFSDGLYAPGTHRMTAPGNGRRSATCFEILCILSVQQSL